MDERISVLRDRLIRAHDEAMQYITYVAQMTASTPRGDPWARFTEQFQGSADALRRSLLQIMVDIGLEAQSSILVDETDLRLLRLNAKKMAAALRFRLFTQWGIYIHHDEGSYIGMDPPGQSEDEIIQPDVARSVFLEGYRQALELLNTVVRREPNSPRFTTALESTPSIQSYVPKTAFIMMAIDPSKPDLQDVRDAVKDTFKEFGISAIRADEIEHSDGITNRIVEEIQKSEYLLADLTGERPSVYYEIGYAHAIGKTVILFRKKGTSIHFDLAYRNCPEYESLADLRLKIRTRLKAMTGK